MFKSELSNDKARLHIELGFLLLALLLFLGCDKSFYGCVEQEGGWCCKQQVPEDVIERWRNDKTCEQEGEGS